MKTLQALILGFISGVIGGGLTGLGGILVYHFYFQPPVETASTTPMQTLSITEDSAATSAAEKASLSVVSVIVSKDLNQYYSNNPGLFFLPGQIPSPFDLQDSEPESPNLQEIGGGTGFIISADGLILTNKHVVSDSEAEYSVISSDGTTYLAEVLSRDTMNDLAILKIEASNLPVVELGDSNTLKPGETVIAIGNTLTEYQNTITKGVISGLARDLTGTELSNLIQTDAAINKGNSGGPLINLSGQVIGINVAIDRTESAEGIGFAIPINDAKSAIESVEQFGRIVRPQLGVRYMMLNKMISQENQLPYEYGALIVRGERRTQLAVIPGSAADKAGLVENDIILEIDGQIIADKNTLSKAIQNKVVGDQIILKIYHDGEEKEVTVTLEESKE